MGAPSVSNVNPIGPNVGSLPTTRVNLLGIDISFLQLANPPPEILADMAMIYQTPDGSLYQSNGTSLVGINVGAVLTAIASLQAQITALGTVTVPANVMFLDSQALALDGQALALV